MAADGIDTDVGLRHSWVDPSPRRGRVSRRIVGLLAAVDGEQ
jgi:hypothetical protein